jgi:serine/threonine protein kinase/WD40 repeat protein
MSDPDGSQDFAVEELLGRAADEFTERLDRGERPDIEEYAGRYPRLAALIREIFPTLVALRSPGLGDPGDPGGLDRPSGARVLGDFHLLREVGRGGMGIVYEAVQRSLDRRVALKVLPFAVVADPRQLRRFRVEARAAAHLHHSHIIPVYAVGCERGVHYYAMQFIDGRSLAELIRGLRQLDGLDPPGATRVDDRTVSLATGWVRDPAAPEAASRGLDGRACWTTTPRSAAAGQGKEPSSRSRGFVRAAARLGLQAAEALEYAHEQGVIHRDIKPSNLMVDGQGQLWVADFGLARLRDGSGVTLTGDLLGTLSYMSPEQALGGRVLLDHRTDIYSLGVTLYELLSLQPAVAGRDRAELLLRIAEQEPTPLRRLNPAVPADLETIVAKAMAKEPAARYASAQSLADDLRLFLEDRPIRARRPTLAHRLRKGLRRHAEGAVTAAVAAIVALILGTVGLAIHVNRLSQERDQVEFQLARSMLGEARLNRRSGSAGQRFQSLELLARAAGIGRCLHLGSPDLLDLRNEAIACLILADVRETPRSRVTEGYGIPYDEDLQTYAVGGRGGDVVIRQVSDDAEVTRLAGDGTPAGPHRFGPRGRYLAVHYGDGPRWKVWDLRRHVAPLELTVANDALDFSPDGRHLAACSPDGSLHLYELATGRHCKSLPLGPVPDRVRFHPGAALLALCGLQSPEVQVRDLATGGVVKRFRIPAGGIFGIAWSPDGTLLAAAGSDFRIYLWEADSGTTLPALCGHQAEVVGLDFNRGGDLLASRSWDGTSRLWDPRGGRSLVRAPGAFRSFSADDRRVLIVRTGQSNHFAIWEVAAGRELHSFHGHAGRKGPWCVDVSPEGRLMASAGDDGAWLWDLAAGRPIAAPLPTGPLRSAWFDPEGRSLITSGARGLLRWPLVFEPGGVVLRLGPPERLAATTADLAHGFAGLSRFGGAVAAITGPDEVLVLPLRAPGVRVKLKGHGEVLGVAISPDGRWAATVEGGPPGAGIDAVRLWDVRAGRAVTSLPHEGGYHSVAFSPDGRRLVTSTIEEYRVWAVGTWERRRVIRRDWGLLGSAAFSPDGRIMALAHSRHAVRLHDAATFAELATLEAPDPRHISWLSFTPAGGLLVATTDHAIQLWDLPAIRTQLRTMGLDWEPPADPPPPSGGDPVTPLRVVVERGGAPGGTAD